MSRRLYKEVRTRLKTVIPSTLHLQVIHSENVLLYKKITSFLHEVIPIPNHLSNLTGIFSEDEKRSGGINVLLFPTRRVQKIGSVHAFTIITC